MLTLPRNADGLHPDHKATLMGIRFYVVVMQVAAVASVVIVHLWGGGVWPTLALIVAGWAAIHWAVTAVELSVELKDEEKEKCKWTAEQKLDRRLSELDQRLDDVSRKLSGLDTRVAAFRDEPSRRLFEELGHRRDG